MTTNEKDNMIKIFADRNTAMAAIAASMQSDAEMIVECKVSNKDFVWSSR
jgi:hypothetical protein